MESGDGSGGDSTVKSCEVSSGCGCSSNGTNVPANTANNNSNSQIVDDSILVRVTPTTGGQFDILVCKNESVENFKKRLSKKLKVPKERICLLHRDRQLRDGTLQENQLVDGSRLTLLPSVETGLLAQRPEQSVMQALESLNDSQVNDFLSGKAPLNLTMRLGDHMMLIQLQLSTVTPKLSTNSSSRTRTSTSSPQTSRVRTQNPVTPPNTILTPPPTPPSSAPSTPSTSSNTTPKSSPTPPTTSNCRCDNSKQPALDTRALAEASRNLTQTLKQLSSEVLTSRGSSNSSSIINATSASSSSSSNTSPLDLSEVRRQAAASSSSTCGPSRSSTSASTSTTSSTSTPTTSRTQANASSERPANTESSRRRQGAIIESMHHHGKGVYSGTFSGTLNPALQDKFGRPKRDISTIIHILNDLLCATPQYRGASAASARAARQAAAAAAHEAATLEQEMAEGEDSAQLSKENQATRGKMEQLRQIMEERRQRRRARREARVAPYSAAQWAASKSAAPECSPALSPATPTEERPCVASIAASATEESATAMETGESGAELCELNPEPVLA